MDPASLPAARYLNLIYFVITSNLDEKKRAEFESQLRSLELSMARRESPNGERKRKVPSWWKGEEAAHASNLAAARAHGYVVGTG